MEMGNEPPAEQGESPTRAYGMREIPDGLLRGELVGREPLRQRLHARPHAHALEIAVEDVEDEHRPHQRRRRSKTVLIADNPRTVFSLVPCAILYITPLDGMLALSGDWHGLLLPSRHAVPAAE